MGSTFEGRVRALALASCVFLLTACGGGGDAPPPPPPSAAPPAQVIATMQSNPGGSSAIFDLFDDGTVAFEITLSLSLAATVTEVQLHPVRSVIAHDEDVVVDFLGAGTFELATGTLSGTATIEAAVAADVAANPGDYLISIEEPNLPGGSISANLALFADLEWHALLRGSDEAKPFNPDALGFACLDVTADGAISYVITMVEPPASEIELSHIHLNAPGGEILVNLNIGDAVVDASGTITGNAQTTRSLVTRIQSNPAGFFINTHTKAAPVNNTTGVLEPGRRELKATLSGAEEEVVVDAAASAAAVVRVRCDGTLDFSVTAQESWVGEITAMHIHRGAAGSNGDIEVNLLAKGATFDPASFNAAGTIAIEPTLAVEIAANPQDFYVNVHTESAPMGLVRGQLAAFPEQQLRSVMRGSEEAVVEDPNALGSATFDVHANGHIEFVIAMVTPIAADITQAHIHIGAAGQTGVPLVDLRPAQAVLDEATGTLHGTVTASATAISRICANPAGFYVNVHTTAAPAGIARGQLGTGVVEMWAPLSGAEETEVIDAAARGGVAVFFQSFTSGRAHLAVPPDQLINAVTAAHLHAGAAGEDGPIVVFLTSGADYTTSPPSGSAEGSLAFDQKTFTRILANPAGFYANFHTAAAPLGLVRGQVSRNPVTFRATMSGAEVITPVDPATGGFLSLVFDSIEACHYNIDLTTTPAASVTGAHVHDGGPGVAGPILIDFFSDASATVSGAFLVGEATFAGRTFARLLAAPELCYADVATAAAPAGLFRGQLMAVDGTTAPAGLLYSSLNATFETGGLPIAPLVPQSSGGPVHEYTVSPALPAGLSIDRVSGVISGLPTAVVAATNYTVTARNDIGEATVVLNITTVAGQPSNLTYTTPVGYVQNTAIVPNAPTNSGGTITNYTVLPALPAGLTLSATTGIISGTPTVVSVAANYTITGSNAAGSTQAVVNIAVTAALQPPNISYVTPQTYTTGTAIAALTPTNTGGAVTSWTVGSLPVGLAINPNTGVITGTPTAVTPGALYQVTATNAAGSSNFSINITVNLGAPANLSYSPATVVGYVNGNIFTNMTPTVGGGAVASYSINPALPAGITLNTTTGVISNTTIVATSNQTTYTVTATNATGSTTASVTITILP